MNQIYIKNSIIDKADKDIEEPSECCRCNIIIIMSGIIYRYRGHKKALYQICCTI